LLALEPGAASWLVEAAAAGTRGMRRKMAEACALAKLPGTAQVTALGTAAIAGPFADNDLIRILAHHSAGGDREATRASETHSLQPGTSAWARF
jgi:hypothetical protein